MNPNFVDTMSRVIMMKKLSRLKSKGKKVLKYYLKRAFSVYIRRLNIDNNLIIFESYQAKKFSDSPRAMYEYIKNDNRYTDYRFVWVFNQPDDFVDTVVDSRTRIVKMGSLRYRIAYAKAKYWVMNGWIPDYIHKNKKQPQVAMQCWHGTPLKRLRGDINKKGDRLTRKYSTIDVPSYDYFLSPSPFASAIFTSAFRINELNQHCRIVETGYPRNDILVNYTQNDIARIKERLVIPSNKKIALYAPTWRDDQGDGSGGFTHKMMMDFQKMQESLGDEWVILFRTHYFVSNQIDTSRFQNFVIDVSKEDNISDLYLMSDILITDYSSVFFDYAILRRPILFFMYDIDNYRDNLRGFYLSLDELPGEIVKTEDEIIKVVRNLEQYQSRNQKKYDKFSKKFNNLEDGNATERAVNYLLVDGSR